MDNREPSTPYTDYSHLLFEQPTEENMQLQQARARLRIGFAISGVTTTPEHFEELVQANAELLADDSRHTMDPNFRANLDLIGRRDTLGPFLRRR